MRNLVITMLAVVASAFFAVDAQAATKTTFKATVAQVRASCSAAGGTFGVHMDGGGYGCVKSNCDGKGGDCRVDCDNNNNCTGRTPRLTAATGIFAFPSEGVVTSGRVVPPPASLSDSAASGPPTLTFPDGPPLP